MAHPLSRSAAFRLSLILLAGTALLARLVRGPAAAPPRDGWGPIRAAGWEAYDLPVSGDRLAALGAPLIFRQYRAPGRAVNLYLVSAEGDRAALHPPEYCFVGGATELTEEGEAELSDGKGGAFRARRFLAAGPGGRSLVYYWYLCGGRVVTGYLESQSRIALGRLLGQPSPAFLVRLSVEGDFETEEGERAIRDFLRDAAPDIWMPRRAE